MAPPFPALRGLSPGPSQHHVVLWRSFLPWVLFLGIVISSGGCGSPTPTVVPTVTSTSIPVPTLVPPFPIIFIEDFEAGLGQWFPEANVPMDPDNPGKSMAWSALVSSQEASEGSHSTELFLDGRRGAGTIWLQRPVRVNTEEAVRVDITFQLWSEGESMNTLARVAGYAGVGKPVAEADFDTSIAADLASGWREYKYVFDVLPREGSIFVAVGITIAWETEVTYYIDDIRVEVTR